MSVYRKKIFPQRFPQNFHGQSPPQRNLREVYKEKTLLTTGVNPQAPQQKIVNWQLKRTNKKILDERREYLTHTGKISNDTPTWFQSTGDFYRRGEAAKLINKQSKQENKSYDVFNRRRFSLIDWRANDRQLDQKLLNRRNQLMQKSCAWNVTAKIGQHDNSRSTSVGFFRNQKPEITSKIGSVEGRDFSIKRPQMKIGKSGFVDTYSPF